MFFTSLPHAPHRIHSYLWLLWDSQYLTNVMPARSSQGSVYQCVGSSQLLSAVGYMPIEYGTSSTKQAIRTQNGHQLRIGTPLRASSYQAPPFLTLYDDVPWKPLRDCRRTPRYLSS